MNTYSETTIVTRDLCASGTDVPRALAAEPQTGKVGHDQPCTSTEIIARGRASLAHIERGHWPDWRNVIAALAAGRRSPCSRPGRMSRRAADTARQWGGGCAAMDSIESTRPTAPACSRSPTISPRSTNGATVYRPMNSFG